MSRASEMQGFLPDDYLELRTQRRTNILWALVFLVVAGSIGWAYMIAQKKVQQAQTTNQQIKEKYAGKAGSIELFKKLQEEQNKLNTKAELVGSLGERVNRSNVLAELTNRLPAGMHLTELALDGKRRSDAGKTTADRTAQAGQAKPILYDVTLKITGLAPTDRLVAEYMSNLERSSLIKEVQFDQIDETLYKEIKLRKFELTVTLDPAADTRVASTENSTTKPTTKPVQK